MKKMFFLLAFITLGLAQSAEDIALRVENTLRSYQSFQANFEQLYYSTTVSTPLRERGKVYFKKPDLMKWEYQDPEEKVFLIKDGFFWDYNKEEKQLIKYDLSSGDYNSEVISLLSGKVALLDTYSVDFSPFPTEDPKTLQIKLTPKDEEFADTFLLLEIDEETGFIQKLISFDWTGNKTEFQFNKVKTNIPLDIKTFELRVPPDVEIIENK
jgi:outer membrane lipoprotein carrier protein